MNGDPTPLSEDKETYLNSLTPDELTEEELELDLRVYGCSFYKWVDGKKVRVHPRDVRFINGEPRDSSNTIVVHQQEG